jgi:hypothetical protein
MRAAALLLAALALAGCESTQAKSARLAKSAKGGTKEHGVTVSRLNPDVHVVSTALVHDAYGAAAVVELRSAAHAAQADLPVALVVRDAAGKAAYANDIPGLEHTLTHVPLLLAGQRAFWVDDQVKADKPHDVQVKIGTSAVAVPAQPPRLVASGMVLEPDPSGAFTRGTLRNDSGVEQRALIVYAVAERGGKVVAAGRAGVERLKAHSTATFKVFWIGDPRHAHVRVFAPPTVLEEGAK